MVYDNGPTERYGFGLNAGNLNAFVPPEGRFSIRQNGHDGTEVMTVTGAGDVGIGKTLDVTNGITIKGELPFIYKTMTVPSQGTHDIGWEVSKYMAIIVGFNSPPNRVVSQVFIDNSGPTLKICVWSSAELTSGVEVHYLLIRKELFSE